MARSSILDGERNGNLHSHRGNPWHEDDAPEPHNPHPISRTHRRGLTTEGSNLHLKHKQELAAEGSTTWVAMDAKFSGACKWCNYTIRPGDPIWYHPTFKPGRNLKCRGNDCDAAKRDEDAWDGDEKDKESPPPKSTKASKEDFENFDIQIKQMGVAVNEAKERSAKAEERADDAENATRDAIDLIEKARRIEIVRTLPSGAKKVRKLGPQHHQFEKLLNKVRHGINVAMVGDAGSGKTRAPREVAKALKLPFYLVPLGPMTSKSDLLGFINGAGKYVYSLLCQAYEHGGVVLMDEMDAANPAGLTICHGILDSMETGFADKMRTKHPDCHFLAAMNTWGRGADAQFVGRAQLDAATLNRWYYLEWDTDWDLTHAIVKNKKWVDRVQALSESAARQKVRVQIGMRTAIMGNEALKSGDTQEEAEHAMIWAPTKPDDKQKILAGLEKEDSDVVSEQA